MEGFQLRYRNENNDGLLATPDINLARSGNLEGSKLSLELGNAIFQVKQGLRNRDLSLIGGSARSVGGAEDLVLDGHIKA